MCVCQAVVRVGGEVALQRRGTSTGEEADERGQADQQQQQQQQEGAAAGGDGEKGKQATQTKGLLCGGGGSVCSLAWLASSQQQSARAARCSSRLSQRTRALSARRSRMHTAELLQTLV